MAGADDPIAPLANARLLCRLIPRAELKVFDCGHLFLLTRAQQAARAIEEFLDRPEPLARRRTS
jgi:pimeloyl-ACP methyl ester carboxylesterase